MRGHATPVRSGRQVGQRLARGTRRAPSGERERERAGSEGRRLLTATAPGPASPRATRTPLGRARGPGPGAIPGGGGRGRSRGPPTTRLGRRRPPYPSRAGPPATPTRRQTGGARAGAARLGRPRLRRRWPRGAGREGREGREGARAGWGRGSLPCRPRAHAPAAPASLRVPLPRERSGRGAAARAFTWEGGGCGFLFTCVFLLFAPWEEVPQILATSCLAPPRSRSGVPGRSSLPHPSSEGSPSECSLSPLDSSQSFRSFRFCNLVSDAPFPLSTSLHTGRRIPFQNKRRLFSGGENQC